MRTPEEIEVLIAIAKHHNLKKLKLDGFEIVRFVEAPFAPLENFEAPPFEPKEPLERKRDFYELAYGRSVSDEELTLYPEAG